MAGPVSRALDNPRVVSVDARNSLNTGAEAPATGYFERRPRTAVGAAKLLADAEEYKTVAEAVADCTLVVGTTAVGHRDLQHPLRKLDAGARLIRKRLATSPVAP